MKKWVIKYMVLLNILSVAPQDPILSAKWNSTNVCVESIVTI